MFKQNEGSATALKNAETIIGESIKVKGNFHGEGNMIIEGEVEGSIKTNSFLLIGSKSLITAAVEAKDAKISGNITGNVLVHGYLEIMASAKITGDISAALLSIEKGALVNGQIKMGKQETLPEKSLK